jgi:Rhabdovirus nucleocapsid protein
MGRLRNSGTRICDEGSECGPADILKHEIRNGEQVTEGGEPQEDEIHTVLYYCAAAHRISIVAGANNASYLDTTVAKLATHGRRGAWRINAINITAANLRGLGANQAIGTMVAALDMFLNRYPSHPWALLRIGSSESRMRECTIVEDLGFISELTGLPRSEAVKWVPPVFGSPLEHDVKSLLEMNDELDNPDSYLPYLRDMNLTPRSPYTVSAEPEIHHWVHLVGTFMGSSRSKRAGVGKSPPAPELVWGSALMAYCCSKGRHMQLGELILTSVF